MPNEKDTPAYRELRQAAQVVLSNLRIPRSKKDSYRIGYGPVQRLEQALTAADAEVESEIHLRAMCDFCGDRVADPHAHKCKP